MDTAIRSGWETFQSYSPLHLATVMVCVASVAGVAAAGRITRDSSAEPRVRIGLASIALAIWIAYTIWWNWNGLDLLVGLPLHICDVGGLIAPFALLTGRRWLRATLYFWAFALTIQAYIQPVVSVGPAAFEFWGFWITHTIIVMCAVYDIVVLRFRPTIVDLGVACGVTLAYGVAVTPLNVLLGANYGYIGDPAPGLKRPAILDLLGPWPFRAFIISALVAVAFCLTLLPWEAARRLRGIGDRQDFSSGEGAPARAS